MIDIANHARHEHAGYRLLKRCIRHALDSPSVDIRLAKVSVVKVEYETALLVEHKVRASMKQELYDVTVCFTKQTVFACSCTCKCGGQGTEKILCIHVLPVMYQMSLLVFEGLAEHILVELAAFTSKKNESSITEEYVFDLLNLSSSFILCSTKTQPFIPERSGVAALKQLLHIYSVGTSKSKKQPGEPTDREQLKSLRELDRRSSITKAFHRLSNNVTLAITNPNPNTGTDTVEIPETIDFEQDVVEVEVPVDNDNVVQNDVVEFGCLTAEQYTLIAHCCWDVCRQLKHKSCDKFLSNLLGFRLIALRSLTGKPFSTITRNQVSSSITRNLMELFNAANGELGCKKKQIIRCNSDTQSDTENIPPVEVGVNTTENVKVKKRKTCCCCHVTNRLDKNLNFYKLPMTTIVIDEKSSDDKRLKFYEETYRRKVYLQRFGLSLLTKNNKYLLHCSNHQMQAETFDITNYMEKFHGSQNGSTLQTSCTKGRIRQQVTGNTSPTPFNTFTSPSCKAK
jgi:hypothetical protein